MFRFVGFMEFFLSKFTLQQGSRSSMNRLEPSKMEYACYRLVFEVLLAWGIAQPHSFNNQILSLLNEMPHLACLAGTYLQLTKTPEDV